jgi:perosamine synthetase
MMFDWPTVAPPQGRRGISVAQPTLTQLEAEYLLDAFNSSQISGSGFYVDKAEQLLEQKLGTKTLTVSNGSVALILALKALGIGKGDEVLVPALTYAATASSVTHVGADPVFCDVEAQSWNISLESMKRMLTPRTKALIVVHLYGVPAQMDQIIDFANENDLKVIEDAAECFGGKYEEKTVGTIGDAGTYSFFANKAITSGEGGAVTFKSKTTFEVAKLLKGQGMDGEKRYYFLLPGFNFRLNNLSASILVAQLERFNEIMERRVETFSKYDQSFSGKIVRQISPKNSVTSPWLYTFSLPTIDSEARLGLAQLLADKGIETRPIFYPLNIMPAFQEYRSDNCEISQRLAENSISIPTYYDLTDSDLDYVIENLKIGFKQCQT